MRDARADEGRCHLPTSSHYPRYAGVTGFTPGSSGTKDGLLGGITAAIVGNDLETRARPKEDLAVLDDLTMPPTIHTETPR